MYQFSGATFDDGPTASGYFDFNPATSTFGPYSFTTTNGTSDGLVGTKYQPGTGGFLVDGSASYSYFGLPSNSAAGNFIAFVTAGVATSPGTYALAPGSVIDPSTFANSGEFTPTARSINAGFLIVTPAAVPEASTTISFGLLLAFGGVAVAAKRKRVKSAA